MDALTSGRTGKLAMVVALLAVFYVLMSFQVDRAATFNAFHGTVLTLTSPFQRLLGGAWSGVAGLWDGYVGLVGSAEEAERLRQRVAELQRRQAGMADAVVENARLRALLDLPRRRPWSGRAAPVVGRDLAHGFETLTLGRGSRDGIVADSPVLAPDGHLVGRVVHVAPWTSLVQLITDPQSAVGARIGRSRAAGVVHGGGGATLSLDYVESSADVAAGDLVVTSGTDGVFPPGIPVGRVRSATPGAPTPDSPTIPLERGEAALFLDIVVAPLASVRSVEQLMVLDPVDAPAP